MTDILFIYPPYISKYKNAPLGLAYLASFVEQKGYRVKILDMDPLGISFSDLNHVIKEESPELVGISFMTNQYGNALKVAKVSKGVHEEVPVVVGGNHVSAIPEEIMENEFVDFAVVGEGEITFLQLVESLDKGINDWKEIDGLVFKENGNIIRNRNRDLIADLDKLPFPKWDDFPIEAYSEKILGAQEELPVFSILTSRGCPGKCAFCSSHTVFTRKFRKRSAENIFEELQYLEDKFDARHFNFVDDTLTVDKQQVHDLCDLLIKNQKDYRWLANARVNTVDQKLLRKMYYAGCRNICFGVESGDPVVREKIGKRISEDEIRNAHKWAKDAGLIVSTFFMVGNIGETWDSIDQTIALAKELRSDHPSCSIATPYPDTQFMEKAEKNRWLITKEWDKYMTSPHLDQDFSPVTTNGILKSEEILEAYYKVNAAFAKIKLKIIYGDNYLFNPKFYAKEVYTRIRRQGIFNFIRLGNRLIKGAFSS